jgi:iron complex outermembrane receptor protein
MNHVRSIAVLALSGLLPFAANAQQAPAASTTAGTSEISEVIVTGTRRTDRTVAESSAAIDVLNGADLAKEPSTNMLDTLSNMVPSFIVGQNSISDASSFVRSPSLRGLPADEMLVMLNGKRLNRSALVQVYQGGETELAFGSQGPDLASIPSIAIKSLEILRDGASAQYGSDAIAGVLNYQFRTNSSGVEVSGRYGEYFPNGYSKDGGDGQIAANIGLPLGGQGFANISAEVAKNQQTVRNPTRPSAVEFAIENPSLAPELPHYPGPVQQWGTPPSKSLKTVLNAGIKLDNNDQLYAFGNYAKIDMDESFNYRLPVDSNLLGANGQPVYTKNPAFNDVYLTPCPSTYTGCPNTGFVGVDNGVAQPTWNLRTIYPAGYTPRFYGTTEEFFGAVGYKGVTSSGVSYDLSGTTAQNSLALGLKSSINPSLGPLSPTSFYVGKFEQQESNFNLDLSYPWKVDWLVSPLSVAGGLEWRNENYKQLLGDPASYAAGPYSGVQSLYACTAGACVPSGSSGAHSTASNGFGGISAAVDASQSSYAGYVDLEGDVTKALTLGLAGRIEYYDSFGTTTLGKFQARFKATDWLALRGTASTGFHAPSPGQSNVETLSTTFIPGTTTQVQIGTYRVTSSVAKYYGAVALKPEESTNLSAGLVLTPMPDLLITLDGYSIEVRNRIGISQQFNVTAADIAKLADLAYVGVGGTVQYFTNGFSTKTKGVDLVASYPFQLGSAGRLDTTLAYNYNKSDVTSYNPLVISQSRIVDIQHYAPNSRVNLGLSYAVGKLRVGVHENYYGTWRDENDYAGQLFSAKETTDLDVSYEVVNNVTASIGGRNIFNAMPDVVNGVSPITGGLGDGERYPRTGGPFGYNGAFWYARVGAKF